MRSTLLWVALVLGIACHKDAPPPAKKKPVMQLSTAEIQRSQDACKAYVDKVCACMAPGVQHQCELAKASPAAIQAALDVATNPGTEREDALRAQASIRETVKECIEDTAKLPALGCP